MLDTKLNEQQQRAMDAMLAGENVFLTGGAGTGKTFVLKQFIKKVDGKKKLLVCASTGKAAVLLYGLTIHSAFHIPVDVMSIIDGPDGVDTFLTKIDCVIVDEISMCRMDVFEYMFQCIELANQKRKQPIQLIFVGDFYQLAPVLTRQDKRVLDAYYGKDIRAGYAFQSPYWHELHIQMMELTLVKRQHDYDFIQALNQARIGDVSCIQYFNTQLSNHPYQGAPCLFALNAAVQHTNLKELSRIEEREVVFDARIRGQFCESYFPVDEHIHLKVGCKVLICRNEPMMHLYVNGDVATVVKIHEKDKRVEVKLENGKVIDMGYVCWDIQRPVLKNGHFEMEVLGRFEQLPFKLGYALTMHKAQGMSLNALNLDPNKARLPGQLYVGLSRARSANHLYITRPLTQMDFVTNKEVNKFYKNPESYDFFFDVEEIFGKYVTMKIPQSLVGEVQKFLERAYQTGEIEWRTNDNEDTSNNSKNHESNTGK